MEDEKFQAGMRDIAQEIDNKQTPKQTSPKKHGLKIVIGGVVLILLGAIIWWFFIRQPEQPTEPTPAVSTQVQETPQAEETTETTQPEFDAAEIKKVLNDWTASAGGTYGVTITDENGKVLAEKNGQKTFFTASIYKLYTAYIGYQKIDDGTYKLSEPYLNGWTRGKCLDEMIRTSNSPCAEKLWNELGKENLTDQMKAYGLKNTSMTGLTTSSGDAAVILANIETGKDLSTASRKAFMNSMLNQIYQDTLQTGFKKADVYSKIGFNGDLEYHDTAIVHLKDGRSLVVSVLTSGVGTQKIAQLGAQLETALED